jgi:hypothetical protein
MSDYKIVYGIVDRDGTKDTGKGFTCERKEKGEYVITYDSEFQTTPAVTATAEHAETDDRKVLNVTIDKETDGHRLDEVIVLIQKPDGKPNDNRFHFIAVAEE